MLYSNILSAALLLIGAPTLGAQTFDDFESYSIAGGTSEQLLSVALTDETVTGTGQGPDLVADGCRYSAFTGTTVQWNGQGYLGLPSKSLNANGSTLSITYDKSVSSLSLDLHSYDGFAETVTIRVFSPTGNCIGDFRDISVPDSSAVPFSFTNGSVKVVDIIGATFNWSPVIDNHEYTVGPFISISGSCGNSANIVVTGARPLSQIAVLLGTSGSSVVPVGPCIGTELGLAANPTLAGIFLTTNVGGLNRTTMLPASVCGMSFQVLNIATCRTSNVVTM